MQLHASDLKVKLVSRIDPTMPILLFDPEAMHRALLNVVTNAIDACDEVEGGTVTISSQYDPQEKLARLVVNDNGAGIPPEDLDAIFHVFVSRKGGRGTGLGLPVSRKIMEEHGGQITVKSEPGAGSTFTLEIPANQPSKEQLADYEAEMDTFNRLAESDAAQPS
jgi:signal transduction histidine kinase